MTERIVIYVDRAGNRCNRESATTMYYAPREVLLDIAAHLLSAALDDGTAFTRHRQQIGRTLLAATRRAEREAPP